MIRVTIELIPGGIGEPEHLGTAIITNDVTGDRYAGNYDVVLGKWGRPLRGTRDPISRVWRRGRVEGFARRQLGPWDLLYLALKATVGNRAR